MRLPPGAIDKFNSVNSSYANGTGPEVINYTPAVGVDLFIAAFVFSIEDFSNTTRIILQGNFTDPLQAYMLSKGSHWFQPPYPFMHSGDGTTAVSLRASQFTGVNQRMSAQVWAWEEKTRG